MIVMTVFGPMLQWALVGGVSWFLWQVLQRYRVYSSLRNLPGPPSHSFWTGNIGQFHNRHGAAYQRDVALNYGPVVRLHSFFSKPVLYVSDPKALNTVILKEENIYEEDPVFLKTNRTAFGPGLSSTLGEHHRRQRKMLNPVFSVSHMRHMLPIFYGVIHKLSDAITTRIRDGPREIDVLSWTGRTALELIGQGGLGYSFDSLVEDTKDAYGEALKSFFPSIQELALLRLAFPFLCKLGPAWLQRRIVDKLPNESVQKIKTSVDIMSKRSTEIFNDKKAALERGDEAVVQQIGEGKDLMSILLKANMVASEKDKLPETELLAQMSTMIIAAMDTTSNALARMLYLLAEHPQVQEKLRDELLAAQAASILPYDELNSLPILNAICRETLRLYPPGTLVSRVPNKDAVLPLSEPICGLDGRMISEIPIAKGTEIIIGVMGCNANKALWGKDALEWKPERWLAPLPAAVTEATIPGVYSNLMTFLGGKRACIGFKFSEMEMKIVLSVLVSTFKFSLTDKPIEWNVAGVWYPTVGRGDNVPQMPLIVELWKNDA